MSRARTIAPLEVHAGPTFVPRRITKHLGRGMERHAAGTAIYRASPSFLPAHPRPHRVSLHGRCAASGPTLRLHEHSSPAVCATPHQHGRPQTRPLVVLAACHCVTPTCRSRCGPIRLSNTLSTIVTPSRTFAATWFKPLLAYTWLPAIDVAGT